MVGVVKEEEREEISILKEKEKYYLIVKIYCFRIWQFLCFGIRFLLQFGNIKELYDQGHNICQSQLAVHP